MVWFYKTDGKTATVCSGRYLPDTEQLRSLFLQRCSGKKFYRWGLDFDKDREGSAAKLAVWFAQWKVWHWGYDITKTPIETSVLWPRRKSEPLASWYKNEPRNTDLRLFVHRYPQEIADEEGTSYRGVFYPRLWPLTHRKLKARAKTRDIGAVAHATEQFLEEYAEASNSGHVGNLLEERFQRHGFHRRG